MWVVVGLIGRVGDGSRPGAAGRPGLRVPHRVAVGVGRPPDPGRTRQTVRPRTDRRAARRVRPPGHRDQAGHGRCPGVGALPGDRGRRRETVHEGGHQREPGCHPAVRAATGRWPTGVWRTRTRSCTPRRRSSTRPSWPCWRCRRACVPLVPVWRRRSRRGRRSSCRTGWWPRDSTTSAPAEITDETVADLWDQVARLRHAGIAHRDLRLGNMMIDGDGPRLDHRLRVRRERREPSPPGPGRGRASGFPGHGDRRRTGTHPCRRPTRCRRRWARRSRSFSSPRCRAPPRRRSRGRRGSWTSCAPPPREQPGWTSRRWSGSSGSGGE